MREGGRVNNLGLDPKLSKDSKYRVPDQIHLLCAVRVVGIMLEDVLMECLYVINAKEWVIWRKIVHRTRIKRK